MNQSDWKKRIEIKDGKRSTYRYRKELYEMGFRYNKSSGVWILYTDDDPHEQRTLKHYCRTKKLAIRIIDRSVVRDQTYRKKFLKANNRETYLCAYCGKKITKDEMAVDHIVPVKAGQTKLYRVWKRLFNIKNINNINNLAPSCSQCNTKKGAKGGLWILRGIVGKNTKARIALNITRRVVIIADIIVIVAVIINLIWITEKAGIIR